MVILMSRNPYFLLSECYECSVQGVPGSHKWDILMVNLQLIIFNVIFGGVKVEIESWNHHHSIRNRKKQPRHRFLVHSRQFEKMIFFEIFVVESLIWPPRLVRRLICSRKSRKNMCRACGSRGCIREKAAAGMGWRSRPKAVRLSGVDRNNPTGTQFGRTLISLI